MRFARLNARTFAAGSLLAATTAALLLLAGPVQADDVKWITSFADAKAAAKKDKKIVLADFTGSDWCTVCHKLHKEVFETKEFQDWADKKAVLLELDYPRKKELAADLKKQNDEIQQKSNVQSFPTVIFFDAEGTEIARTGYVKGGPAEWIKAADAALAEAGKKKAAPEGAKAPDAKAPEAVWLESYDKAIEAATKDKKLVFADFTGTDWCPWCIKLREEVFDTKEFKDWAAKNAVLLEVDFPREKAQTAELKEQNQKLEKKYEVEGYPTVVVLDAKGTKVGELGYQPGGPAAWIAEAQKLVDAQKK